MPIEMPRGLPFSVDTFTSSSKKKRHHFLTHAHKDHTSGISTHFSFPIYCTHLTKTLLLQYWPQLDDSIFVNIEVGQSLVLDDHDGKFIVKAFDANHCPGAVMFLFEGSFGNILHTGDCRLSPECIQCLPDKYIGRKGKEPQCRLDYIFLDCTFGRFCQGFPSKHSAMRQVINCIWKNPDAPVVYLTCDLLGQEEILSDVSRTFGSKIYVDKSRMPEYFQSLMVIAPEILSEDSSSRFQVFEGFPKLSERAAVKIAEARSNLQPEPLIIRPSSQWYACDEEYSESGRQRKKLKFNEAVKDQFGIWHVCYSMHSSREELEWALQLLMPKRVVSTTPNCRAIELDYVRKHCFGAQITPEDPLWKLLDINFEAVESIKNVVCSSSIIEEYSQTSTSTVLQPIIASSSPKKLLSCSSGKKLPLTLFGRARHGLQTGLQTNAYEEKTVSVQDSNCRHEENKVSSVKDGDPHKIQNRTEREFLTQEVIAEVNHDSNSKDKRKVVSTASPCSSLGSFKSFNGNFRKLYRSMNVPVPQPLPSLVELMNSNKRSRRKLCSD